MRQLFTYFLFVVSLQAFAQEQKNSSYIDVNYFRGNIALHNNSILHLIKGHPEGIIIAWNKKTFGHQDWEQRFNYPDYGLSFIYQDLKNDILGNNYAFYGHYNFYFFKRNLMFRIGQGLAFTSNPYDKIDNHKNIAFGTKFMSGTYLMLNYKKERVFDRLGLQAGLTLTHYSNANVKAPNTSINTIALNIGVTYNLAEEELEYVNTISKEEKFTQPIKYNVVFRSGMNESDVIDSGQFPFYIFSTYADKRINQKSALQLGADVFFSNFLKEFITYNAVAFPERNESGKADYKRVGIFIGHELFINKMSVITQFGYYVYYPYDFEGRTYFRLGLKRYFGDKWFGALSLKAHGAAAEAVEFGIGIRL
jgi:Lipid A 3-O-deacylase (PagL)